MDRLALDAARVRGIADGARAIAALPDPVGEVVDGGRLANGLEFRKVRVPLGVIAVVYEARPNVTIDAAALCLKSGNAVLLRGSSSRGALERRAGADRARGGGRRRPARRRARAGRRRRPRGAGRARAAQEGVVDLIIPRGGEGLKKAISAVARVPVIYAAAGNCHVYVDASADLDDGRADHRQRQGPAPGRRATRPRRCSCTPPSRPTFLPRALAALRERGVELRGDERVRAIDPSVAAATESDWGEEFLALILAVRVVDSYEDAIDHVNTYGSGHSEAIVTNDRAAARAFQLGIDSACIYVNASTRFTDGGEFGMGAEIGNSTQKLHARGPIGLRELCSTRYLVDGDGQIRGLTRVGLLGGTFNPPHLGHLVCAQEALRPARARPRGLHAGLRAAAQGGRARPRRRAPRRALPARRGGRRALRGLAPGGRRPGSVLHGRYPREAA